MTDRKDESGRDLDREQEEKKKWWIIKRITSEQRKTTREAEGWRDS